MKNPIITNIGIAIIIYFINGELILFLIFSAIWLTYPVSTPYADADVNVDPDDDPDDDPDVDDDFIVLFFLEAVLFILTYYLISIN